MTVTPYKSICKTCRKPIRMIPKQTLKIHIFQTINILQDSLTTKFYPTKIIMRGWVFLKQSRITVFYFILLKMINYRNCRKSMQSSFLEHDYIKKNRYVMIESNEKKTLCRIYVFMTGSHYNYIVRNLKMSVDNVCYCVLLWGFTTACFRHCLSVVSEFNDSTIITIQPTINL